jgi:hypothetical protein
MMRRIHLVVALVALLTVVVTIGPALAGENSSAAFALSCDGFTGSGDIVLDRDNTGALREAFIVVATDGIGNIIYDPVVDSFFVGGKVTWDGGSLIPWAAEPQYNPLTLRVVSLAGNDLDDEVIVLTTGSCEGLPTYGALPEGVGLLSDGETSPSVDPNAVPPRPTNSDDVIDALPGFLIVNTDNLSLRTGDGPEYTLVGIVDGGIKLIPLGRNVDFSWWLVQADDIVGWAKAEFLVARGNLTDVPVVESQGVVAQPTFFLFSSANLVAAPNDTALPLCSIAGQWEYVVVGRDPRAEWYEVQATCDNALVKGWVSSALGAFRSQSGVPVPVTSR